MKKILKSLLPPILIETYRKVRYSHYNNQSKIIWEGIYKKYEDIPKDKITSEDHDGMTWAKIITENTKTILSKGNTYQTIPFDVQEEHMLLPLLVAVLSEQKQKIKLLDWGGGAGIEYIHLKNSLAKHIAIEYTVIEHENVCKEAVQIYLDDDQIKFYSSIPTSSLYDVILVKSALQYTIDYKLKIEELCALGSNYIFFIKLNAGDFPTYITLQKNIPYMSIPYWLINIQEIISIMKDNGYILVYKSVLKAEYYQDNFPEEYKMEKACNVLFVKN